MRKDTRTARFTRQLRLVVFFSLILSHSFIYAQEFRTGCVLDPALYDQAPLAAPLVRGDYMDMPSRVSFRKYAPIPQNQGAYGTCVGWSTAYAARTILMAKQQGWTNQVLITENAFSPFFIYEKAKSIDDIYCQEGTSLYNALEIIKDIGVVRLSEFRNQCGQPISSDLQRKAFQFRVRDYRRLFESSAPNKTTLVKKSLAEGKPVVIGMQCCTQSFLNAKGQKYWSLQSTDNPSPEGGHALTIIGFDDNYNENGGAFELMNSWGTTWGEDGFIWMSYDDFERYCFEAYEMNIYQSRFNQLAGNIRFLLSAGNDMDFYYRQDGFYETIQPYQSGTLFRMYIDNQQPAYVYVLTSDLSGQIDKVFPPRDGVSAYLSYKKNTVAIPGEDYLMQMDNQPGIDYFCVLYATEELGIGDVVEKMNQYPSHWTLQQKLKRALGSKLMGTDEVSYNSKNAVNFQGESQDRRRTVLPVIFAVNHN